MSQPAHPTLINLPQPQSQPDTPSEMPGTPTSTTTSLSALSTTAIKDGHRGHVHHAPHHRGHQHTLSTNSLEAERADRISRLTGLSGVSALRGGPPFGANNPGAGGFPPQPFNLQQTTPTSAAFPHLNPAPAYFDAAGQPVAATKMSTVGSASATESIAGRTSNTETADGSGGRFDDEDETRRDEDEDERSIDTNEADTEIEMDSASGYMREDARMDEDDNEMMTTRSTGTGGGFFDMDRMSDDGSASLVGFGEGAGSTVSGPIYHRRPLPPGSSHGQGPQSSAGAMVWGLERSSSGLSEGQLVLQQGRRDAMLRSMERENSGFSSDTPVSQSAIQERREALMVDGVALDGQHVPPDDDVFVDTSTRGPIPVLIQQPLQANMSAIRETQQPHSHQQQQQQAQAQARMAGGGTPSSTREAAERILRERLDHGEGRMGGAALGSPKGNEPLGRFYFEERK
ncbi:hypothetical protein QBC34DRAFT_439711 [Podospora aff. communis PSN243]|uniref:Uncharacterized protein n=1 Tax=Podospora aff. communis PSN243 TaxID=3040156 RepID=A0AAV9GH13_9PEZI|nr:hypothetical protein QBC34DRAFT_439711 [Podospora aff. communis PSN243]